MLTCQTVMPKKTTPSLEEVCAETARRMAEAATVPVKTLFTQMASMMDQRAKEARKFDRELDERFERGARRTSGRVF